MANLEHPQAKLSSPWGWFVRDLARRGPVTMLRTLFIVLLLALTLRVSVPHAKRSARPTTRRPTWYG